MQERDQVLASLLRSQNGVPTPLPNRDIPGLAALWGAPAEAAGVTESARALIVTF